MVTEERADGGSAGDPGEHASSQSTQTRKKKDKNTHTKEKTRTTFLPLTTIAFPYCSFSVCPFVFLFLFLIFLCVFHPGRFRIALGTHAGITIGGGLDFAGDRSKRCKRSVIGAGASFRRTFRREAVVFRTRKEAISCRPPPSVCLFTHPFVRRTDHRQRQKETRDLSFLPPPPPRRGGSRRGRFTAGLLSIYASSAGPFHFRDV